MASTSKLNPHQSPDAVLDADIAMAWKGRGKTFTAKDSVERLLQIASRRTGPRSALGMVGWNPAKTAGRRFSDPVFGGPHADIPLHDATGMVIVELIAASVFPPYQICDR
jgi:hypothetical protein